MRNPIRFDVASLCLWMAAGVALGAGGAPPTPAGDKTLADRMSYLDNGTIRLGVNRDLGGAITWLSRSGSGAPNLINNHDWGRQVQMSFYSGPVPYAPGGKQPHKAWMGLGWNPIQSGDVFNNRSRVLEHRNDGKTIYVKCVPMHWPLDNVPGECTFECWIELKGSTASVRSRLSNARVADKAQYPARYQELPAVYTNSPWWRWMTYAGDQPFTGGALTQVKRRLQEGGWAHTLVAENWAALVNDDQWGVGVYAPGVFQFSGGFAGEPKSPGSGSTGYLSPIHREILDWNIDYEYRYVLIVGSLSEIRQWVYQNAPRPALPAWRFEADRQHWWYHNARDAGWPIRGELAITSEQRTVQLFSPESFWPAEKAPRLYLEAAFGAQPQSVRIFWKRQDEPKFSPAKSAPLTVAGDGQNRLYEADLSACPEYKGAITALRIDVIGASEKGDTLRVKSVSFAKPAVVK